MTTYSLTYSMLTGCGHTPSGGCVETLERYRDLERAGAGWITIRDGRLRIVSLSQLIARSTPLPH